MLIATRLGIGIRDPGWFRHRIALLSAITAPSLLAQDDQAFEWAVFAEEGLITDVREELERIFAPFDGRAFLDTGGHNENNLLSVAERRGLVSPNDYVLTGRIDDDDAWNTRTVSNVRNCLRDWLAQGDGSPGFAMTFENGLVWVMYDMVDVPRLLKEGKKTIHEAAVRPFTHPFTSISGFVYSLRREGLTSISTGHSKIGDLAKKRGFCAKWIATEQPMWLYCRHKQTTSVIGRALEAEPMDLTLTQLQEQFGIDQQRTARYISEAVAYDYSWVGHWEHRNKLRSELRAIEQRLFDELTSKKERVALVAERTRLRKEFDKASEDVMFRPPGEF
jgi:hypothetical protein